MVTFSVVDTDGFVIPSLGIEVSNQTKPHPTDEESSNPPAKVSWGCSIFLHSIRLHNMYRWWNWLNRKCVSLLHINNFSFIHRLRRKRRSTSDHTERLLHNQNNKSKTHQAASNDSSKNWKKRTRGLVGRAGRIKWIIWGSLSVEGE